MREAPIERGEMRDETTIAVSGAPAVVVPSIGLSFSLVSRSRYLSSLIAVS